MQPLQEPAVGDSVWKPRGENLDQTLGMCVCVCPTLDKGSHPTTFTQAGGQCTTDRHCPTKTLSVRGEAMRDAALCTCSLFHKL